MSTPLNKAKLCYTFSICELICLLICIHVKCYKVVTLIGEESLVRSWGEKLKKGSFEISGKYCEEESFVKKRVYSIKAQFENSAEIRAF